MIIRANNYEPRNNSEYFIVDRQYVVAKEGRFDLTGFYWPSSLRRKGQTVSPCLIEIKFALNQEIQDIHEQLSRYYQAVRGEAAEIAEELETIFRQKLELGLFDMPGQRLTAMKTLTFSREIDLFQFLVVLVDYNPKSKLFGRSQLSTLPFANQVRIFESGFAMWGTKVHPIIEES